MREEDLLSGNLDYCFQQKCLLKGEIERLVDEYDPQNEVVLLIQRSNGQQDCLRVSTPTGHLPPLAATEESFRTCEDSYLACEESFREAHGPFDVFQSLRDDPDSEQDQHPANELPPVLKESILDFLRALRFGLEAFYATGLELDELCPNAFWGDSCVDRLVLLSALRDGIIRIDDSDGKRRWRPGPEWTNVEKVLLSQPETDAMPSWWELYYPALPLPS
jgi:hypothetical protein